MFKSFSIKNYTLVDDNFEVTFDSMEDFPLPWIVVVSKEYKKRNLNVVRNMLLFFEFCHKPKSRCSNLVDFIETYSFTDFNCAKRTKAFFQPYLDDIKKYSALT